MISTVAALPGLSSTSLPSALMVERDIATPVA